MQDHKVSGFTRATTAVSLGVLVVQGAQWPASPANRQQQGFTIRILFFQAPFALCPVSVQSFRTTSERNFAHSAFHDRSVFVTYFGLIGSERSLSEYYSVEPIARLPCFQTRSHYLRTSVTSVCGPYVTSWLKTVCFGSFSFCESILQSQNSCLSGVRCHLAFSSGPPVPMHPRLSSQLLQTWVARSLPPFP